MIIFNTRKTVLHSKMNDAERNEFLAYFGSDPVVQRMLDGQGMTKKGRLNIQSLSRSLGMPVAELHKKLEELKESIKLRGYSDDEI